MGGNRKFHEKPHGEFLIEKWKLHKQGDDVHGWDVNLANEPASRKGGTDPVKKWYDEVEGTAGWEAITLQLFRSNVKSWAAKFLCGPFGQDSIDVDAEDDGSTLSESDSGFIKIEVADGKKIVLAYHQCLYSVAKEGEGWVASKIFIVIHAVSGWYISQEKDKGDFFLLRNDGNGIRLSVTGNERMFDKNIGHHLLVQRGDVFGRIYAPKGGVQHPAVAAFTAAVREQAPQGEVPSHTFEIPLLKRCMRFCPIEGLHNRTKDEFGRQTFIPVEDPVPAVSRIFLSFLIHQGLFLTYFCRVYRLYSTNKIVRPI